MRRRFHQAFAAIGGLWLLVLHHDFWIPQRAGLWQGWLPHELAYRLAWIAVAWVYLLYFCSAVWPDRAGSDGERRRDKP